MSASLKQIEEQARELNMEDRAKLAESMLESLRPPLSEIEAAWAAEIEKRVAAYDSGEIASYDADEVFAVARRLSQ
jgi:putative addiction module component (TIGR02574 family)